MAEEGFYITLPSDSSHKIYPDNKIESFRTHLPKPIKLQGAWEVGLISIQYPRTWETASFADTKFVILDQNDCQRCVLRIRNGHYKDIHELTNEINTLTSEYGVICGYDTVRNLVYMDVTSGGVKFFGRLITILGLNNEERYSMSGGYGIFDIKTPNTPKGSFFIKGRVYAPHPADIQGGLYSLFVYSDIVTHTAIGDHFAPLLRTVHIDGTDSKIVSVIYDRVHYKPVSKTDISDILIEIKSDKNQNIPFRYGKTLVKLHFRPIKNSF